MPARTASVAAGTARAHDALHAHVLAHVWLVARRRIFSPHNFAADGLREALGFDTHAEVMSRMGEFMGKFWSLCPSLACGFKVFPGQVRPSLHLAQLFDGLDESARRTLRMIVLERENVTAEWLSVTKASATGNWGTSPQRQQTIASSTKLSQRLKETVQMRFAASTAIDSSGGDGAARSGQSSAEEASKDQARAAPPRGQAGVSLEQFTREHRAWYTQVARIATKGSAPIPKLHVTTESLIGGGENFEQTMRGVYDFLGLPTLDGPIRLPSRVTAPDKRQATKRVSKSKSYKQRRENELKRRAALGAGPGGGTAALGSSSPRAGGKAKGGGASIRTTQQDHEGWSP